KRRNDYKMSTKKKVLKNSFLYIFSSLLVKSIGFLLLPVYTFFLTPEDYGIINLINSFNGVATFIIAFSLYSAIIRFYADFKNNREKLKRFYGTVITFVFISGITFFNLSLIFRNIIILWFFEGVSFYPFVFIALLTLTFVSLHSMHQSMLQGMQKGKKLTIINLSVFGLTVFLKLFFIGYLKFGAVGVLLAQLIINVGYFMFMLFDLKKNNLLTFCMDFKILRESLKYSIPLMPHNLSVHIANFASRLFVNISGTLASVGLYSIASQFGGLIDVVQASVNKAFQPWFYDMMNRSDEESKIEAVNLSSFLLILYSLVYMGVGLFSQEIIIIMTQESYLMAWTVIPIFVIGYSVKSIYYFYINIMFYYKSAARKIFIATILGSFTDIIFLYLLVPQYGMYGAAFAFLLAKILVVAIVVFLSKEHNDVGYRVTNMLSIILPSIIFMAIGLLFSYTRYITVFSWYNLLYKILILIIYLIFICFSKAKMIKKVIKSQGIKQKFMRRFSR
ncbi:MAG: oligosaccharide flippase family protein, partial [bacterium]